MEHDDFLTLLQDPLSDFYLCSFLPLPSGGTIQYIKQGIVFGSYKFVLLILTGSHQH